MIHARAKHLVTGAVFATFACHVPAVAEVDGSDGAEVVAGPAFNEQLAGQLGADDYGMRSYVFVLLKTGPAKIEDDAERSRLFSGHFANMSRLAEEGLLVLAGPLDGENAMRGIFVLAAQDIEEARAMVATDPAVAAGLFEPEFHSFYGSAMLMRMNELHATIQRKQIGE